MVLDGVPTQVMMMMVIMIMMVVIQRSLPTNSQGRGITSDPANRQIDTDTDTKHISSFNFSFLFISMYICTLAFI